MAITIPNWQMGLRVIKQLTRFTQLFNCRFKLEYVSLERTFSPIPLHHALSFKIETTTPDSYA